MDCINAGISDRKLVYLKLKYKKTANLMGLPFLTLHDYFIACFYDALYFFRNRGVFHIPPRLGNTH